MIDVKSLSFQYNAKSPMLYENLSFSVKEGEVLVVLGKNGIGKTTLLKCITTELKGYTGEILIDGKDIRNYSVAELSKMVAIVASNNPCYQNLKVADYLVTGYANTLTSLQMPSKKQYEEAYRIISDLGQEKLFDRSIFELSSGEMQIVKLGRAIIQKPKVILFDEPTSNLDVKNQLMVLEQISYLSSKGFTVITTTHNPGHAIELNGKVLLFLEGAQLFGDVKNVITEDRLRSIYDLDATISEVDGRLATIFYNHDKSHKLIF